MFFIILSILITFLVGIISALIIYARWKYGTLERLGIPTIKPHWLLGSYPNMHKVIIQYEDMKHFKKYGRIWGAYEGREPQIFIADPELVRLICIKHFDYFQNKKMLNLNDAMINEELDILPYEKWKADRMELSPSLSTKIRLMSDQMLEPINECTEYLKEICSKDPVIEVRKIFNALSVDVIPRCAFGTKIYNCVRNPSNEFVINAKKIFEFIERGPNFRDTLLYTFPIFLKVISLTYSKATKFLVGVLRDILKTRRSQGCSNDTFVDALNTIISKAKTDEQFKRLNITELTAMAQAFTFLVAAVETTSSTMTMLIYYLAMNPSKQKLLHEEVDRVLAECEGKIDHSIVGKLVYLNACIEETLRLSPVSIRIDRMCTKNWQDEKTGLKIPKGMRIQIPAWPLHYNPEYFPETESFVPERILSLNKNGLRQYALQSFGHGPHNCVGARFAQENLKLSVTAMASDFYFEACDETKLVWKPAGFLGASYKPLKVKLVRRN